MKQGAKYGLIAGIGVLCVTAGVGIGLGASSHLGKDKSVVISETEESGEEEKKSNDKADQSDPTEQVDKQDIAQTEDQNDEAQGQGITQVGMKNTKGLEKYEANKIKAEELLANDRKWTEISKSEWQETLKQEKLSYIQDANSFLLPDSSNTKIVAYDYFSFDKELCDLARNEIYARHGYQFTKPEYQEAFKNKAWYAPTISDINKIQLTKEEIFNVNCLKWWATVCDMDHTTIKDRKYTDCYYFDINTPFEIDIDGDGNLDHIILKGDMGEYDEYNSVCIQINDTSVQSREGFWQPGIAVVDVDPEDTLLELVIYDMGPSSDPVDEYYYYQQGKIKCMGSAAGHLNTDTYIENKVLHAVTRSDILGTNYYRYDYELTPDHSWQEIPFDLIDVNVPIIANETIQVYEQRSLSSKATTCKEGTPFMAIQTDLETWIKVRFEDGHEGWINEPNLPSWGSLGGLLYCD